VRWDDMVIHLKRKSVWAFMTPDEEKKKNTEPAQKKVRGILGQARLLHILRKVDAALLKQKKIKRKTGNVHSDMRDALKRGLIDPKLHKKSQRDALYKEISDSDFALFSKLQGLSVRIQGVLKRVGGKETTVNGLLAQAGLVYKLRRLVRGEIAKPEYGELPSFVALSDNMKQLTSALKVSQKSTNVLLGRAAKALKAAKAELKAPAADGRETSEQTLLTALELNMKKDLATAPFRVFAGKTAYLNVGLRKIAVLLNLEAGELLKSGPAAASKKAAPPAAKSKGK
jgi:hypothetical protein